MKIENPHYIRNFRDLNRAKQKLRGQRKATRTVITESWRTTSQLARQRWYLTGSWMGMVMQGLSLGKAFFTNRMAPQGTPRQNGGGVPSWLQWIMAGLDLTARADAYRQQAKKPAEK